MIRNNLAMILSQKEIKISRMALDTGLSRTTLTALSQNESKRIDNDTLNTILMYLQITPNDFFNFVSYDCEVIIDPIKLKVYSDYNNPEHFESHFIREANFDLFLKIDNKISSRKPIYEFEIQIDKKFNRVDIQHFQIQVDVDEYEIDYSQKGSFTFNIIGKNNVIDSFNNFMNNTMPSEFQREIEHTIIRKLKKILEDKFVDSGISESWAKDICSNADIVSSDQILGFLPF